MTPLAEIIYDILRRRTSLEDPRITYSNLPEQVRDARLNFAHSFGSCSFDEPVRDLEALGLL